MKYIILILMFMGSAQAWDGEIGIGESKFTARPDGVWYQQPFPHELHMTSPSAVLGITGYIEDGYRYRLGYKYLGQVTSTALAVGSDAVYSQYGGAASTKMPLSLWLGKGHVNLLYATVAPEYRISGLIVYPEIGITPNQGRLGKNRRKVIRAPLLAPGKDQKKKGQ